MARRSIRVLPRLAILAVLTAATAAAHAEPAADRDPVRARWEAAGATGALLDLLARTDGFAWRLPGGEQTRDPARIAAAPVLFQWLVAQDPAEPAYEVHTVEAYRVVRGEVRITSRTYRIRADQPVGDVFQADPAVEPVAPVAPVAHARARRRSPRRVVVTLPVPMIVRVPR